MTSRNVNDNLLLEEEGFVGGRANWRQNRSKQFSWTFFHTLFALFILFPYVSIPILFAWVASVDNVTNNYSQENVQITLSISKNFINDVITFDSMTDHINLDWPRSVNALAVSLNQHGEIQLGAGTSIYKNQSNYYSSCPSYVDLDGIYGNAYLISYFDKYSESATLSVAEVDIFRKVNIKTSYESKYDFYQTTVLDESNGIFVFITQDTSSTTETAFVVAGRLDESYQFSIGDPVSYADLYSVNPSLTRLSENSFAMSYYDLTTIPATVQTRYGTVDVSDLSVKLSDPVNVIDDIDFSVYNSIVGLTANSYLIMYYNSNATDNALKTIAATVIGDSDATKANVVLTTPSTLSYSRPAYYLTSSRINNNTAIVVFAESYFNYGLRAVVISTAYDGLITYTSSLMVTSGQSLNVLVNNTVPDLDVSTIYSTYQSTGDGGGSGNATIAILFSDYANGGSLETILLQLTSSGTLVRTSPNFVLNNGNPNYLTTYSWGALAAAYGQPFQSQTLIVSTLTDVYCSSTTSFEFSVMDILPSAVGIVSASSSSISASAVSTVVSGLVEGFTDLIPGKPYYSTTKGTLIPGPSYAGRYSALSLSSYIDTASSSASTGIITSQDSYMGIAISPTTLLIGR